MCNDKEDKLLWTRKKNEFFFVKALYKDLESRKQMDFPTSIIWNSWVLPKVSLLG